MEVERQRQSLSSGGEERARHACVCLASDQMSRRNVAFGRGTLSREEDDGVLVAERVLGRCARPSCGAAGKERRRGGGEGGEGFRCDLNFFFQVWKRLFEVPGRLAVIMSRSGSRRCRLYRCLKFGFDCISKWKLDSGGALRGSDVRDVSLS